MSDVFSIKVLKDYENTLVINFEKAAELSLSVKRFAHIIFGIRRQAINISKRKDILKNEVFISQDILTYLLIPSFVSYEIRVLKNEIIVGPYIGLLINRRDAHITQKRLNFFLDYVINYPLINGAVLAFALDGINYYEETIEGYVYDDGMKTWKRGVYPMPASIYRKVSLKENEKNYFIECIGDRLFNSYFFDKFETYNWLKRYKDIESHLPYTKIYNSYEEVFNLLKKYESVYVKPIAGRQGKGVIKVVKEEEKFCARYREKGKNINQILGKESDINKLLKGEKYIVQQGIEIVQYEKQLVDFRVIMQKSINAEWQCSGIIARIGQEESVVSNVSNGGIAKNADVVLRKYFNLYEVEIFMLKEKIISFSIKVCKYLDELGINLGNLGLDIALDKKENLWLIEINNKCPAPSIALDSDNRILYYRALTNPMLYAKNLAGFGEQ